jgi:hypothetical protein
MCTSSLCLIDSLIACYIVSGAGQVPPGAHTRLYWLYDVTWRSGIDTSSDVYSRHPASRDTFWSVCQRSRQGHRTRPRPSSVRGLVHKFPEVRSSIQRQLPISTVHNPDIYERNTKDHCGFGRHLGRHSRQERTGRSCCCEFVDVIVKLFLLSFLLICAISRAHMLSLLHRIKGNYSVRY